MKSKNQLKRIFGDAARLLQDTPQEAAALCLDLAGILFLRCIYDRYDALRGLPEGSCIGTEIQGAMQFLESKYRLSPGTLPGDYTKYKDTALAEVLESFADITMQDLDGDALGSAYEDYLYRNAKALSDAHGVVYTPDSMIRLMVNILEPDGGVLLDPACGSGRMFLESARYGGSELAFYGQELMEATGRLCVMNLLIQGLNGKIAYGSDSNTLYRDAQGLDGRCDFVLANPPFKLKKVDTGAVLKAGRLPFGLPSSADEANVRNANYLWLSYCYAYLNTHGRAGIVLSSSTTEAKGDEPRRIRRELVETGHVEVMLSAGNRFFRNRNLGSTLWFLNKGRSPDAQDTTLFINARDYSSITERTRRGWSPWQVKNLTAIVWLCRGELEKYHALLDEYRQELLKYATALSISVSDENVSFMEMLDVFRARLEEIQSAQDADTPSIQQASTIANEAAWIYERFGDGVYRDIPGLCRRVSRAEIAAQEYSMNPAVYVGLSGQTSSAPTLHGHEIDADPADWQELRLGDIADVRGGLNFSADDYKDGAGILRVSDFKNRTYPDYTTLAQIRVEHVKPEDNLHNGDIVVVRSNGNSELVGRCMLIKDAPSSLTFSHGCIRLRLRDPDQYDPEFITYLLKTGSFRKNMASLAKGGSTKNLSQSTLMKHTFRVPDINRQRRVAADLRTYDSRMEENERQIRILREKASRLYQQWFEQYRIPGLGRQDVRPEDWPAVPLGELLEIHCESKPAGSEPGDIPVYSSSGILRHVDTPALQGEHILIPRKGNLQNVRLVDGSFCANDTLWCGHPRKPGTAQYLYHFLLAYGVEKLDRGARKPEITKGRLKRVMVPLPGADLLAQFEKAAAECYQLIASLEAGNRVLEHERDALIEKQLGRYSSASF